MTPINHYSPRTTKTPPLPRQVLRPAAVDGCQVPAVRRLPDQRTQARARHHLLRLRGNVLRTAGGQESQGGRFNRPHVLVHSDLRLLSAFFLISPFVMITFFILISLFTMTISSP